MKLKWFGFYLIDYSHKIDWRLIWIYFYSFIVFDSLLNNIYLVEQNFHSIDLPIDVKITFIILCETPKFSSQIIWFYVKCLFSWVKPLYCHIISLKSHLNYIYKENYFYNNTKILCLFVCLCVRSYFHNNISIVDWYWKNWKLENYFKNSIVQQKEV